MEAENTIDYLDPKYFVFELPLYSKFKVGVSQDLDKFLLKKHTVDYYNPIEKTETTYEISFNKTLDLELIFNYHTEETVDSKKFQIFDPDDLDQMLKEQLSDNITDIINHGVFFSMNAICLRTKQYFIFHYYIEVKRYENNEIEWFIQKIGQYPSRADFELSQIKKYAKILGSEYNKEYTRAIGLYAAGIGIGSFVYLRRIFESLIEDAHSKAKIEEINWNEDEYKDKRMIEKIKRLKNYLPLFLYKNAEIYGILSKGVHELSEEDCLNYFDTVRGGIDIILGQKYDEIEQKKKEDEVQKKINELNSKIK